VRRVAVLALAGGLCVAGCDRADGIVVENAWVRAAPPGAAVQAGYMTLRNRGHDAVTLVGARSVAFAGVEMHESVEDDGTRAMRPIGHLDLAAGGRVQFEPGGRHLMLVAPARDYRAGEAIRIVLVYEGGYEHGFDAEVRVDAP
jgi:hypothetical protein